MSIVRAPRPQSNFYLLDKTISEDKRLSWAARGLLVYLLGKPDHWKVSPQALVNETAKAAKSTGRDGVYNLLSELISTGYAQRRQTRLPGGRMGEIEYHISEAPLPETPDTVAPDTASPHPAKPRQVSIEGKQGLTGSNTPHTPQGGKTGIADAPKKKRGSAVGLPSWLESIRAAGEKPIPADDTVFTWADEVGLPRTFLGLAWAEFKSRYCLPDAKRYTDWRSVFRKAVRGNWMRLWYLDGETYVLTTQGQQARKLHREAA